jgi:hypothetical protein
VLKAGLDGDGPGNLQFSQTPAARKDLRTSGYFRNRQKDSKSGNKMIEKYSPDARKMLRNLASLIAFGDNLHNYF